MDQVDRLLGLDVESGEIEHPLLDIGLKGGMALPKVEIIGGKVGHHIFNRQRLHKGMERLGKKLFEEVDGKSPRPRAQFQNINGLTEI